MTRINVVSVQSLHDKHLLAEYRELPRLFGHMRKYQLQGKTPDDIDIPPDYVLGKGHVKFFINKGTYLINRQRKLIEELLNRNFNITYRQTEHLIEGLEQHWLQDYKPTKNALMTNMQRINERLENMK